MIGPKVSTGATLDPGGTRADDDAARDRRIGGQPGAARQEGLGPEEHEHDGDQDRRRVAPQQAVRVGSQGPGGAGGSDGRPGRRAHRGDGRGGRPDPASGGWDRRLRRRRAQLYAALDLLVRQVGVVVVPLRPGRRPGLVRAAGHGVAPGRSRRNTNATTPRTMSAPRNARIPMELETSSDIMPSVAQIEVDEQDRRPMRKSQVEQPMVDVATIGAERGPPRGQATHDHPERVDDRHRQHQQRHDDLRGAEDREDGEHVAHEHHPGRALEDHRGVEVPAQEAEQPAGQDEAQDRDERLVHLRPSGSAGRGSTRR